MSNLIEEAKAAKAKVKLKKAKSKKAAKGTATEAAQEKTKFKFQNKLKHDPAHWWAITNDKTFKPGIIYTSLVAWLHEQGFQKYKLNELQTIIVFVKDNIVRQCYHTDIWQHIFDYLGALPDTIECVAFPDNEEKRYIVEKSKDDIQEMYMRTIDTYISNTKGWHYLPTLEPNWMQDNKQHCYKFYQNCFVDITAKSITVRPYAELEGHIWENQKIDRDFDQLTTEQRQPKYETDAYGKPLQAKYNFIDFFIKIASCEAEFITALYTIVGHCLHDFFDSKPKAIMLTDRIAFDGPSGRTGKGLLLTALGKVTNMARINGKDFKESDAFKYQSVDLNTKVIAIDDIHKKFSFEERFNDISEGIEVNQKGLKSFRINAKMLITTNKTLEGESSSHTDRRIDFALANFFCNHKNYPDQSKNAAIGVGEYYGEWFFSSNWSPTQWQYFDNFIAFCIQQYLVVGKPIQVEDPYLQRRKLYDRTCEEFVEFMDERFKDEDYKIGEEHKYDRNQMLSDFITMYGEEHKLTQSKFGKWKKEYCTNEGLTPKMFNSNSKRYISFLENNE